MWKKIKFHFKEIWNGAKIGLIIGVIIGFISVKLRHIDNQEAYHFIILSHLQVGILLGAFIGAIVKLVRLWRARKARKSEEA